MAKSKLTPELVEILCYLKSKGLSDQAVCGGGEISLRLLQTWIAHGEKALTDGRENRYSEFLSRYQKAETECKLSLLETVQQEAKSGSWAASAWLLERCYPHEYGRKALELTGKHGGAIQTETQVSTEVSLASLSNEELQVLEGMAKKVLRQSVEEEEVLLEMETV